MPLIGAGEKSIHAMDEFGNSPSDASSRMAFGTRLNMATSTTTYHSSTGQSTGTKLSYPHCKDRPRPAAPALFRLRFSFDVGFRTVSVLPPAQPRVAGDLQLQVIEATTTL